MYVIERRYGEIVEFTVGEGTPDAHTVRIHVGQVGSSQVRLAIEANRAVRVRRVKGEPTAVRVDTVPPESTAQPPPNPHLG